MRHNQQNTTREQALGRKNGRLKSYVNDNFLLGDFPRQIGFTRDSVGTKRFTQAPIPEKKYMEHKYEDAKLIFENQDWVLPSEELIDSCISFIDLYINRLKNTDKLKTSYQPNLDLVKDGTIDISWETPEGDHLLINFSDTSVPGAYFGRNVSRSDLIEGTVKIEEFSFRLFNWILDHIII